jgi:parallel beta-helix repeat protein
MKKGILKVVFLTAAVLLSSTAFGGTYTVDDDGGQDFITIQEAIDAATAGDIVYVYPGTYHEKIVMKDEVNVLGHAPNVTTIDGQQLYEHVVEYNGTAGAAIAGFRIKGSMLSGGAGTWHRSGIYAANGPLMIRNNIIEDNHGGIAVKSGANPQIINNTIVNNFNGIIFEGRYAMAAPERHVLVIYNINKTAAALYQNIFEADGIMTDITHIDDVAGTNLSDYRLIVAAEDTGAGGSWGTEAAVDAIINSRLPVLGIGNGGSSLFTQMGISINYGNSMYIDTGSMYVVEDTNPIFERPHEIYISPNRILQVYDRIFSTQAVYGGYADPEAALIGSCAAAGYPDHYPLASEEGHYLWGYRDTPDHLTKTGQELLVNIVRDRITRCDYYLPNPVLVPLYSEPGSGATTRYYFRVDNWY